MPTPPTVSRLSGVSGLGLLAAVAGAWIHLFGSYTAWATPVHTGTAIASVAIAIAIVVATWRGSGAALIAIPALLLGFHVAIIATTLAGVKLIPFDLFPDARLAVVVAACCGFAVYGLVRRRIWGRWLALALGAVGALTGGLNAAWFWKVTSALDVDHVEWSNAMYGTAWVMLTCALGGLAIVVCLIAPAARDACSHSDATWTTDARLARLVRPMLVTAFAAVPMLLVYAWLQPIVPATRTTAIVLAVVLSVGATLTVRGKLAGALLLVVAGLGMLGQTAATVVAADGARGIAGYYVVFWLPAAVCAIVCGIRLAGPTWRLLRGR